MPTDPQSKAKSRGNRLPSAKNSDNHNGEAPSSIHQHVLAGECRLDTRPTRRTNVSFSLSRFSAKPILDLIKKMKKLSAQLPDTIPEASDADVIHRVITTVHGIDNSVSGTLIAVWISSLAQIAVVMVGD
jgi:hypothetical protein